jgi:PAS domain S-box-containing protein
MSFYMQLADLLSKTGYSNLKLARSLTERETLIESLRTSEEQFRLMFEYSSVGMSKADMITGRFLRVNGALCRLLGYSQEELLQRTFFEVTHPEDRTTDQARFKALVEGEITGYQLEKRYLKPDGAIVWAHVTVNLIHDAAGHPLRTIAVIQDITERKRADEEREATVEFLRFINASRNTEELIREATTFFHQRSGCEAVGIRLRNDGDYPYFETRGFPKEFVQAENRLCACDEDGRPICDGTGNPVLECMCGNVICGRFNPTKPFFTDKGSFWSNNTTELLASTSEADRQARTRNRCNGEGYESVALIPFHLGTERLGLLQLNDRRTGRFTLETITLWERLADYLAVALAKFRADEALLRTKEEWERTFDSVPDLIAILDNQHRVLRVNQAMATRIGVPAEDCVGLHCYEVVHGTSCPPGICPHSQTIADGREHTEELREDRLGGDFLVTTTPLFDEKGARIGSVHIAHDITERKQAENELHRRATELQISNDELTRFTRLTVDRELRMIELKKEVNELCKKTGQPPPYPLNFEED